MDSLINRRKFLAVGVAVGVATTLTRPALARATENLAAAASTNAAKSFEFEEATIAELQEGMRDGKWSAREIAGKYLAQIEKFDRKGPTLNSIIELNPDALSIAESLDRERKSKGVRSPLHGIPVLLKDNIDTADRMRTTAGSLALADTFAPRDAFIVRQLREAGAVILGKTNLSEWANFRSTHSSSGWSGRGGQTRNPYAVDRNPCGSSSGSGAAIAANFAAVAVGTETDGSIVCPSSANSLVGIKPTLGLVSRSGIIPISHSQDTAGPMARTVTDAVLLLNALAGIDPRDKATQGSRGKSQADYTRFLDARGLSGARIGVTRKFFGFNDKVDKLMADAIDALKRAGATIVDPADLPSHGKYDDSEFEVLLYEFKADLNQYLAERGGGAPRSLKELIEFNERNREREMPYFGQEIFTKAQAKGRSRVKPISPRSPKTDAFHAPEALTPRWRSIVSTRSSRPPAARRGRLTSSTATTSPAAVPPRRQSPATRTSTSRQATSTTCRSASPSLAVPTANPCSSSWPTPLSRPRSIAARRSLETPPSSAFEIDCRI